jgi:ribosomal protein S18 acetylase RimI-like enzyme
MEKKMLQVVIRPITENDADLMIAFFNSFSDQTRRFFTPHDIDPNGLRLLVSGIPSNPNARRFMATIMEEGKEVMAGYVFFWDWHKMVPWFGIGASDRFQGMGLGNQMMSFAVEMAKAHHKGGILLTTWKDNYRAQNLYKKFGFELIGQEKNLVEYLMIMNFPDPNVAGVS